MIESGYENIDELLNSFLEIIDEKIKTCKEHTELLAIAREHFSEINKLSYNAMTIIDNLPYKYKVPPKDKFPIAKGQRY